MASVSASTDSEPEPSLSKLSNSVLSLLLAQIGRPTCNELGFAHKPVAVGIEIGEQGCKVVIVGGWRGRRPLGTFRLLGGHGIGQRIER